MSVSPQQMDWVRTAVSPIEELKPGQIDGAQLYTAVRTAVSPIEELKHQLYQWLDGRDRVRTAVSPIEELKLQTQSFEVVPPACQNSG